MKDEVSSEGGFASDGTVVSSFLLYSDYLRNNSSGFVLAELVLIFL